MIAQELRLGNLVQCNNFPMYVVAMHDDGTIYCDFEGNEGDVWEFDKNNPCEPIPLTEEILLKCGFERIEVNNEDYYNVSYEKQISNDVFISYADDFSCSLFWTKEDSLNSYGVLPNWHSIDTVHGLQNLHFILTGEELNIQL